MQIKQRPEGFFLHDLEIGFRVREARRHVTAARKLRAFELLAAVKNFAALVSSTVSIDRCTILDRRLVDQRTHQRLAIERIADAAPICRRPEVARALRRRPIRAR